MSSFTISIHRSRTRLPHPRAWQRRAGLARAFTLLEGLIAAVVVAVVASAAAMAVSVGMTTQADNQLAVLAMHAAELQMSSCMEASYDDVDALEGTEETGLLLAPARPGSSTRPSMPESFSEFSRVTSVTPETRTFVQYNGIAVVGKRIVIEVYGPASTLYARLVRFRPQESTL